MQKPTNRFKLLVLTTHYWIMPMEIVLAKDAAEYGCGGYTSIGKVIGDTTRQTMSSGVFFCTKYFAASEALK